MLEWNGLCRCRLLQSDDGVMSTDMEGVPSPPPASIRCRAQQMGPPRAATAVTRLIGSNVRYVWLWHRAPLCEFWDLLIQFRCHHHLCDTLLRVRVLVMRITVQF